MFFSMYNFCVRVFERSFEIVWYAFRFFFFVSLFFSLKFISEKDGPIRPLTGLQLDGG